MLLTIAATSCVKSTSGDPAIRDELVFSAVASHSVKSIITTTNYPLNEPFAVEAVHYPAGVASAEGVSFITGEKVEYDFGKKLWTAHDKYYWPRKGELLFYAGSPIIPQVSVSPEKGVEADWSIPTEDDTQTDLCFARVLENCESHSSAVPIVFRHALSQICFKARTTKHYSYSRTSDNIVQANVITVVLDSVKIHGIVSEGHFVQEPSGWTKDSTVTADYTVFSSKKGLELGCDRYDNPVITQLNTMLLIPQAVRKKATLEEWHHIVVRTTQTDTDTGEIIEDITYTIPKNKVLSLSNYCKEWQMDIKYTFRISVGMDDTDIATAVTDWIETKEIILGDE